jgi:hypothetical protein
VTPLADAPIKRFESVDQISFSQFSGDFNPIHMDVVAARRTHAGAPIVHGMHAVLWALDTLIKLGVTVEPIATLKAHFRRFIYVGGSATLAVTRRSASSLQASLTSNGMPVVSLTIGFGPMADCPAPFSQHPPSAPIIQTLTLADLHDRAGVLPIGGGRLFDGMFLHVLRRLGPRRLSALARLSALVGMVCPGLHSIFGDFNVQFVRGNEDHDLSFRVTDVDDRFRRATIFVAGGGISGVVTAFLRHPPVEHPRIQELAQRLPGGLFQNTTALIIGGSRGVGALTARILIAGGARVAVTYAVGRTEAHDLVREVGEERCRALRYDARENAPGQLADLPWDVNQLYYFATPQIFRQTADIYTTERFLEFCRIYVDGFHAACVALLERSSGPLSVFYPSSTAIEGRPQGMLEYSMAKAAGELLCADLGRFEPYLRVKVARLPRMLTDQTATIVPVESSDAFDVMLPFIIAMHADPTDEAGPLGTR